MGKPTGFLEIQRRQVPHRNVAGRLADFLEVELGLDAAALRNQAARCMDCGTPFCHGTGCPLRNRIPEFNDLVYRGRWREASENLHSTNNFPEFTGRVCPALCEASCTLSLNDQPVLIRHIELRVVERAWEEGWIVPLRDAKRSGRRVAIVGSGPSALAAAQQLARAGHDVVVFEKRRAVGGLLRLGIPDFKLHKKVLDRRLAQLAAEGVEFQTGVHIGEDLSPKYLRQHFDAILLALGAGEPRDLRVPGRELAGVHFALDFLGQQNRLIAGQAVDASERICMPERPSWSWAAATPAATASAPRAGRAPVKWFNWKSCPSRPPSAAPRTRGRIGRESSAPRPATRKVAFAAGRS